MVKFSDNVAEEYSNYLDDESSIAQGTSATRIWFPITTNEVSEVVIQANEENQPLTISGGGTGISGGRAPSHGWILATDEMRVVSGNQVQMWKDPESGIEYGIEFFKEGNQAFIRVPVAMTLKSIQNCCRSNNLMYPPDPTERTSFIGGNVSTNASGARSFKYGATRSWVHSLVVILSNGERIELDRSMETAQDGLIRFRSPSKRYEIAVPELDLPKVTKHVAGPVLHNDSQAIDLFIGTNGIFGIVTEVTLKLLPAPEKIISMFAYCDTAKQALELVSRCQDLRSSKSYPLPMSVEYLDKNAITIMQQKDSRIESNAAVILLEQDIYSKEEEEQVLEAWQSIFESLHITNIDVALTFSENEHHKFLRHWVPEWLIKTTKAYGYPIFVSDTSVPQEKFDLFMEYLDNQVRRFNEVALSDEALCTTIIGHVGDSHPHLCMIPTNDNQAILAQTIMTEIIETSVQYGGSMASEHGLGKKTFNNQPAIFKQYGEKGIEVVRELKAVLDPNYILSPNNIIPTI